MTHGKWTRDPHIHWAEPHFVSDVTGLTGHVHNAAIDAQGRVINRRNPGEVDVFYDGKHRHPIEEFGEWLGCAFYTSHDSETFDFGGETPPWINEG